MDLRGLICPWNTILLWQVRARTKCGFPWISLDLPSECYELGLILAREGFHLKIYLRRYEFFKDNFSIKHILGRYLKESCRYGS